MVKWLTALVALLALSLAALETSSRADTARADERAVGSWQGQLVVAPRSR